MKKLIYIALLGLGLNGLAQQRAITSTYPYNMLTFNPAYAGSLNILSVIGVHRDQWINLEGAPTTSLLSAHSSFASNRVGVGLVAMSDRIGVHKDNSLYASYAYKISTPFGILSMGLQGGFNSRESNFSELTLLDPNDPLLDNTSSISPNFGTGVYFANPNFYAGFSIPFILENELLDIPEAVVTDSRESRYYYFTSGVIFPISKLVKFSPSVLVRAQEQNRLNYDVTVNFIFEDIAYAGVSVRNSGEITLLTQLILNENFRVGYAYDIVTQADQAQFNAGTHEILLNYRIKLKNYKKDPQCPVYF